MYNNKLEYTLNTFDDAIPQKRAVAEGRKKSHHMTDPPMRTAQQDANDPLGINASLITARQEISQMAQLRKDEPWPRNNPGQVFRRSS